LVIYFRPNGEVNDAEIEKTDRFRGHLLTDLNPIGVLELTVKKDIFSGKRRARLEGLEPPTRGLEGNWATFLIDGR
jgi:hypothetical protein